MLTTDVLTTDVLTTQGHDVTSLAYGTDLSTEQFMAGFGRLRDNICHVVRGKTDVVELVLTCFFAEGHLLIEDVPGVGKTTIARALAASLSGGLSRIQFTPDLLPSDVTGVSIFDQRTREFVFHRGPVFANVVLGDEINRASPKTQSALLEVMEEHHVTVDGVAHPVPRPFLVIGTQNPIDMDGTYPLPEAQLDRFLMRVAIGYPDHESEVEVLEGRQLSRRVEDLRPVLSLGDAAALMRAAESVHLAPAVSSYIVSMAAATRDLAEVRLGASPRGSLALARAARVRAASQGRGFVTPADVKALAVAVLAHRVLLTTDARTRGLTAPACVEAAAASVPVPHQVS